MFFPDYIDAAAAQSPQDTWAIVPDTLECKTADLEQQWTKITFADLAHWVNRTAWWIEETLGIGENGQAVGYMG